MVKKVLLAFCLVFSFTCTSVFAISHIVINDAETKDVKNYIIEKITISGHNFILENASDNNLVFLATRTENGGLFGQYTWSYENRLGFTFVQNDKNVILSVNEMCTSHAPNGVVTVQPVGTVNTELPWLQRIKGYFNGMYKLGYSVSSKKTDGGYPIDDVIPLGAFDKAGIKVGDIIVSVNGVKLKADRSSGAIDGLIFDTNRQTTQTFLIKRGEVEKAYTLTSEFVPAGFKKKSNTPNEVVNVASEVPKTETSEKQ